MAKAIANFVFREVIEDAHTKYNISQDDMRDMCKEAVNRSAVLEQMFNDEELKKRLSSMDIQQMNGMLLTAKKLL